MPHYSYMHSILQKILLQIKVSCYSWEAMILTMLPLWTTKSVYCQCTCSYELKQGVNLKPAEQQKINLPFDDMRCTNRQETCGSLRNLWTQSWLFRSFSAEFNAGGITSSSSGSRIVTAFFKKVAKVEYSTTATFSASGGPSPVPPSNESPIFNTTRSDISVTTLLQHFQEQLNQTHRPRPLSSN